MDDELRVSSVELFFDLVFVFTMTQLTTLLVAEPTAAGLAEVGLIFGNLWWMYGGYAWLTNAVPPVSTARRLLVLVGMASFLVIALAIPRAFAGSGVAFGLGYLAVTVVHAGLFLQASDESTVRAMLRLGPYNAVTAAMLLIAGLVAGGPRWDLWIAAFVLHWATPAVTPISDFRIRASHFVERHGLIVLIALGESVVAVGIAVPGRDLTPGRVVTAVLGLLVASGLWWLYFDGEDARAERALAAAPVTRAPWLALFAFGYAFLPLLAAVVVLAAGMKRSLVDYASPAPATTAWFLAAGAAGYLAALGLLRAILRTGRLLPRVVMSGLALLTVVAGREASVQLQLATLGLILTVGIVAEAVLDRRATTAPPTPTAALPTPTAPTALPTPTASTAPTAPPTIPGDTARRLAGDAGSQP